MSRRTLRATSSALAALALSATAMSSVSAAPSDEPVDSTRSLSAEGSVADAAVAAAKDLAEQALVGARQSLDATRALQDSDGGTHVRMERTYGGLPVVGGDLVVHRDAEGTVTDVSQTLTDVLDLTTTPKLSAAKVLGLAGTTAAKAGAPELVVDAIGRTPRLAYLVTETGTQPDGTPSRIDSYVDAASGKTLHEVERIHTVDGEGQSLYGGTVPLNLRQSGNAFQLRDDSRGGTYTIDVGNRTDSPLCNLLGAGCATGSVLSSPDTSFGDGTTASRESAAVDAQYGTDETWDYYQQVHGRDGIFGDGRGSFNRVHYGTDYVNAFWDGEKMTYGDGDGGRFGPLTSLDVAGHEMSHGVTENSANLTYSGESGSLNEATSDIFGTMVEFYADNGQDAGDYLIGEEFDSTGEGLRRMDDPSSDGQSLNCYVPNAGNVDVHFSSGIGNHFFYLLAEGSGAKTIGGVAHSSSTCDGSTVTGIGRDAAQQIWYRALTVYMTSGTDFAGARTATLDAATDLFGAGSAEVTGVADAWSAVDVG